MYCRNCAKKLASQAVACIGCGMNPREGNHNCPACGEKTERKQIICTACGCSVVQENTDCWSTWKYIGFLLLSCFVPVFGWVYGGVNVGKASPNSKRRQQAKHYIYAGIVGLVFHLMMGVVGGVLFSLIIADSAPYSGY